MDFENVLAIASQNQGLSSLPKRYSLQAGPPKKDPKVKGVNSAAVQAFLKKQEVEQKKKVQQMKKQKEELQAKRDELKTSKKARAMASRTKDNFHGYNGVPVVDKPKKRGSKEEGEEDNIETGYAYDDEDNYEYARTDSESEEEEVPERPMSKALVSSKPVSKSVSKKPTGPAKGAPQPMKFDEILKLAAKKQHEPVELKPVPKKSEERPRSAEDLRELEIQRKIKERRQEERARQDSRSELTSKAQHNRKSIPEKDSRGGSKPRKRHLPEKSSSGEFSRKPKPHGSGERQHGSTKPYHSDRPKPTVSSSVSSSSSSGKTLVKAGSQGSAKQLAARSSSSQRPNNATSDLNQRKGNHPSSSGKPSSSGTRPPSGPSPGAQRSISGQSRPGTDRGSSARPGGSHSGATRPSSNGQMRPGSSGATGKMGVTAQQKPGCSSIGKPGGPAGAGGWPRGAGGRPGPPGGMSGKPCSGPTGPGRPKCTVVSETISSKNVVPRPGMASRPGAPPRPGGPPRPGIPPRQGIPARPYGHGPPFRPPGPVLPPITSAYKRQYDDDDDEDDPEMDDFIDDGEDEQDEISKHIREIFGYDKSKYRDESDYALRFMESSWKDQQKEEARSLRQGIKEDQEDMRLEEEENKRKQALKAKRRKL